MDFLSTDTGRQLAFVRWGWIFPRGGRLSIEVVLGQRYRVEGRNMVRAMDCCIRGAETRSGLLSLTNMP